MSLDSARKILELKLLKSKHENVVRLINIELAKLSEEVFEYCLQEDLPSLAIKDKESRIYTIKPCLLYRPSVKQQPVFFAWLREFRHGAIIKETIHPKTLEKWVEEQITGEKPMPSLDVLSVYKQNSVKVRKTPKPGEKPPKEETEENE